jgi:23S rRNA pseudouridine1911/1915/1917 synthase
MKGVVTQELSLLEFIQQLAPESSKNTLRSWIAAGRVLVSGERVEKGNARVFPGQEVIIGSKPIFIRNDIRIVYEDKEIVVLEKPAGLLSVETDFEKETTVHAILKKRFKGRQVFPVHRLDRETSGIMLFAYTESARDALKDQFEQRLIDKTYMAVVEGTLTPAQGTWESYLEEDEFYRVSSTIHSERGKLAITHYKVVKSNRRYSLLSLTLETGRKNQLRVHCADAGYPIAGDSKYGAGTDPADRLCLHAHRIAFAHPRTGKAFVFESPAPLSFTKLFCT